MEKNVFENWKSFIKRYEIKVNKWRISNDEFASYQQNLVSIRREICQKFRARR